MKRFVNFLKQSFAQWSSRDAPRMGASLAFYSILSLAPLLILAVGICALAFGAAGAQKQLLKLGHLWGAGGTDHQELAHVGLAWATNHREKLGWVVLAMVVLEIAFNRGSIPR